jgi:hypothetical protein
MGYKGSCQRLVQNIDITLLLRYYGITWQQ